MLRNCKVLTRIRIHGSYTGFRIQILLFSSEIIFSLRFFIYKYLFTAVKPRVFTIFLLLYIRKKTHVIACNHPAILTLVIHILETAPPRASPGHLASASASTLSSPATKARLYGRPWLALVDPPRAGSLVFGPLRGRFLSVRCPLPLLLSDPVPLLQQQIRNPGISLRQRMHWVRSP